MRGTRSAVFAVACAATALVAVAVLAVAPLSSQGRVDAASTVERASSASATAATAATAGPCASNAEAASEATVPEAVLEEAASIGPVETRADGAIIGTSAADLAEFASAFNRLRAEACIGTLPAANFRIDPCLEARLFWIAEDPSTDPGSAWRGRGAVRSDGVPETGCAGSLAGGAGDTASSVAAKWWLSAAHRLVLFRTGTVSDTADSCVDFAMVHGGVPNETHDFVRAAARWRDC